MLLILISMSTAPECAPYNQVQTYCACNSISVLKQVLCMIRPMPSIPQVLSIIVAGAMPLSLLRLFWTLVQLGLVKVTVAI